MKLWSLEKNDTHRIISILGIRMRFRSKYLALSSKVRKLEEKLDSISRELSNSTQAWLQGVSARQAEADIKAGLCINREISWEPWRLRRINWVLRNYHMLDVMDYPSDRVVVYITDKTERFGLVDRLRTMAYAYVLAAESGRSLHIYHDYGFKLEEYLMPNEVNWLISPQDICFDVNRVAFIFFPRKIENLDRKDREYHVYTSDMLLQYILTPDQKERYSDYSVFSKLFKLSPRLETMLEENLSSVGLAAGEYVVVHGRFLNYFEAVEIDENRGSTAESEEERLAMMQKVIRTLDIVHEENKGKRILLFSDSNYVLHHDLLPSYVTVLPGEVGHVSKHGSNSSVADKAFVDLISMSRGSKVYSLRGDNIYGGNFAKYAALIGCKPYIQLQV